MARGVGITKNSEELSLDWFDAIALDESQIDPMESEVNTGRALVKAMRKGRPG